MSEHAPVIAFGCCRLCPITAEHWHWHEKRPLPLPSVLPQHRRDCAVYNLESCDCNWEPDA